MSPRSASVNEEMRRRSRERLLQATVDLVGERGYEGTTLSDIADRAGLARGLISYYFPGKRHLLQSAVHRLMHTELSAALDAASPGADGRERLARAIDCVLGLSIHRTNLMATHMASLITPDAAGFVECPEQQRLAWLLKDTITRYGQDSGRAWEDPAAQYRLLRALLMGSTIALLLPGAQMPLSYIRGELFRRYHLEWSLGVPTAPPPPGWP
jgi:AcrR family transcriptional regulator